MAESDWSEKEYADLLHGERRRFAWVLQRYGDASAAVADAAAADRYPYEPATTGPLRGLIFHDEAWHWAMLELHGPDYVVEHPDLRTPPDEYEAL